MSIKYDLRGFEEFQKFRHKSPQNAVATITTGKTINLNAKICRDYLRKEDRFVEMFFNPAERIIGIKPCSTKTRKAYHLSVHKHKACGSIAGHAFLPFWKIDHSETRKYEAQYDKSSHMIFINLNKPNSSRL